MAAEHRVAGSLRVVARNDANNSLYNRDLDQSTSIDGGLSRDQVLDYLAQMSSEMHALAKSYNYAEIAYLFKIASREAEELRQRGSGDRR